MSIIGSEPGPAWSGAAAPSSAKLDAARNRRRVGAGAVFGIEWLIDVIVAENNT